LSRVRRCVSEFDHAVCFRRRVDRGERDPVADLFGHDVSVIYRVRSVEPAADLDGFEFDRNHRVHRRRRADFAGHDAGAARGAKPGIQFDIDSVSASTSPADALQNLFSQIDGNGDGEITESEFENALGAGGTNTAAADDVFSKLDSNGDGTVSLDELSSALKGASGRHGHHHAASTSSTSGSTDPSSDPLLQALQAGSATSSTSSSLV